MAVIEGKVVAGHGVASGRAGDPRFPEGTLALQWPIFRGLGLDLSRFHLGTINVSVAPLRPEPTRADHRFRSIKWHPDCAAEDFSFFEMRAAIGEGGEPAEGFIYWPHPETKPEHFQDPQVVELLLPELEGVVVGAPVRLWIEPERMVFER